MHFRNIKVAAEGSVDWRTRHEAARPGGRLLQSRVLRCCGPGPRKKQCLWAKCRSEEPFVVTVGRLWGRLVVGGEGEGAVRMGLSLQG